jgi:iron(III) transport system permease protein
MAELAEPDRLYRLKSFFRKPEKIWGLLLLTALVVLVVIPLVYIVVNSLIFDAAGPRLVRGAREGQPTVFYWVRVLFTSISRSIFYEPALHSLLIAMGMTAISLSLGSLLAYLVVRTTLPWKRFFWVVLIIP